MKYRSFPRIPGLEVSVLGFGCMRLPMAAGKVDRNLSTPLLRRAFDLGVNLFDTATMYCNSDSEAALGEAMQGIRDQVVLSAKNPLRAVTADAWRRQLDSTLKNLRTDHLDIYNHHGINWGEWHKEFDPQNNGLTKAMLQAKAEGLIRHAAFSFHDTPENLKKLADTGYYESVILQYNLLDQVNTEAISYLHEKGIGVIVMGPVGGGRLGIASERILELTGAQTTVEAALRFVWAHPGVNVALSGMQDLSMLEANAALASNAQPFTTDQVANLNALVRERKEKSGLYCSGCKYCLPECASGLPIPEFLEMMNQELVFGYSQKERYSKYKIKAVECIECGRCVEACPQKIDIPAKLKQASQMWDPRVGSVIITPSLKNLESDGSFTMTIRAHNYAPTATPVRVEVAASAGATMTKNSADLPNLDAYARRNLTLTGRVDPNSNRADFTTTTTAHQTQPDLQTTFRYLLVPNIGDPDQSRDRKGAVASPTDWTSGTWHQAPANPQHFSNDAAAAAKHALRFRVTHDAQALILHIQADDDFLFPSRLDRDKGKWSVDCIELFLDARKPARLAMPAYEKGVHQIYLYPGSPDNHQPAFFHAREKLNIEIQYLPYAPGYRLIARIPFADVCVDLAPNTLPKRLGLDLTLNSADATGNRIGQIFFAGNANNWQDASPWATAWLI